MEMQRRPWPQVTERRDRSDVCEWVGDAAPAAGALPDRTHVRRMGVPIEVKETPLRKAKTVHPNPVLRR